LPHQKPNDRPYLISRVFRLKLKELMDDVLKKQVLGKVIGQVYVVEFQKRGLPHAHILLILDPIDKPQCSADFDKIVSAEIPDKKKHPKAFETVTTMMYHGPCSDRCLIDNKCSKKYPRSFIESTTENSNGYPIYRRKDDGRNFKDSKGNVFDNRWIVPHNLYLVTKYNAHINVEL
jgi:hypothetical protein